MKMKTNTKIFGILTIVLTFVSIIFFLYFGGRLYAGFFDSIVVHQNEGGLVTASLIIIGLFLFELAILVLMLITAISLIVNFVHRSKGIIIIDYYKAIIIISVITTMIIIYGSLSDPNYYMLLLILLPIVTTIYCSLSISEQREAKSPALPASPEPPAEIPPNS